MSWKKLFYAGAVLVLTACNNATAPTPSALTKLGGAPVRSQSSDTTSVPALDPTTGVTTECSGFVVHIGSEGDVQIVACMPAPTPGSTISW